MLSEVVMSPQEAAASEKVASFYVEPTGEAGKHSHFLEVTLVTV
jgi:hypothetical protein